MEHIDALRGIESAAAALQRDREKIAEALAKLRVTVEVLSSEMTLSATGALVRRQIDTRREGDVPVSADPEIEAEPIRFAPVEAPPSVRPEPAAAPESPSPEPARPEGHAVTPDEGTLLVGQWLRNAGPKLQVEVERHFPDWPVTFVAEVLTTLKAEGTLQRNAQTGFRYKHKNWSPKVQPPKPPSETPRGSGVRQDTAGTVPTGTPRPREESNRPSPAPEAKSSEEPKASPTPTPSFERGLARSPKPRNEMKTLQREAEAKLDKVVEWAQGKDKFDALTAYRELGEAVFSNPGAPGQYFRTLEDRGVFERTGEFIHPAFKKNVENKGRTTPEFRFSTTASSSPKAEAAPATKAPERIVVTQETVRDVMVEHKRGYIGEICQWLGLGHGVRDQAAVTIQLQALTRRGIVRERPAQEDDEPSCWEYIAPTDEGAAARIDRDRARQQQARPAAVEVAGTGRGIRVGNKEVQAIVDAAMRKWPNSVEFLSKHIRVKLPEGGTVTIAHTPNQRGLLRDKAKLRRAGLALA